MLRPRFIALFLLATLTPIAFVLPLKAMAEEVQLSAGFDPNHILEDEDIFDVNGMSYDHMVNFLRSKGTLADYRTPDIDGVPKTAAEIIWRVANSYKINPKYLLALLQKEQSLVEDPSPTQKQFDWATGYGVCDSCSKDDPAIQNYKGFAPQLEWAAKQFREKYLLQILGTGTTKAGKAPGKAMSIDGIDITPDNNATAMLYAYTPHINGNQNLWHIWQRWFSLTYPDGTVVRGKNSGKTYLIRIGEKRPFASADVLMSLVDTSKIVTVSDTELEAYPDGATIRFPRYALLRDQEGHIWLLTDSGRSKIADMAAFHKFGFNEDEIVDVKDSDLTDYTVGLTINSKTQFPQGVVLRDATDKTLWYVENGTKQVIPSPVFLSLYFSGRNVKSVASKTLAGYTTGDTYGLHDGELVRGKTDAAVYVVENHLLRTVPSADVFEGMGWNWKNVVTLPDNVIKSYTVGENVQLQSAMPDATILTQTTSTQLGVL